MSRTFLRNLSDSPKAPLLYYSLKKRESRKERKKQRKGKKKIKNKRKEGKEERKEQRRIIGSIKRSRK